MILELTKEEFRHVRNLLKQVVECKLSLYFGTDLDQLESAYRKAQEVYENDSTGR